MFQARLDFFRDGLRVFATPGCESNVKEIFDKTWELRQDPSMMIFNQKRSERALPVTL